MGICSSCCNDSAETENAYSSLLEHRNMPSGTENHGPFEGNSGVRGTKEKGTGKSVRPAEGEASTLVTNKRGGVNNETRPIAVPHSPEKLKIVEKTTSEDAECVICLENFDANHPAVNKKCACGRQTRYHLSCILSWREHSEVCPVCRQKITLLDENGKRLDFDR